MIQTTQTSSSASTLGATNGNVHISAGKAYTQIGSDVMALNKKDPANTDDANHDSTTHNPPSSAPDVGHVTVTAQTIDINAAENTATSHTEQKTKQSGLTVAVTNPVITAVQTVEHMQ